jgi:hypothetical protein
VVGASDLKREMCAVLQGHNFIGDFTTECRSALWKRAVQGSLPHLSVNDTTFHISQFQNAAGILLGMGSQFQELLA